MGAGKGEGFVVRNEVIIEGIFELVTFEQQLK